MARRRPIRKPPALRRGDSIGLVAPASPVDARLLEEGIRELEAIGFRVVFSDALTARSGFFAGDHERRTHALLDYLEDPTVRAVFCARGGYGSNYVVEHLSSRALLPRLRRLSPKIVMGYSDATALLLFLNQTLGWVTFQGPMLTKDFAAGENGYDRLLMERMLSSSTENFTLQSQAIALRRGTAEGRLLGGCLSLLTATLGTPQEVDTRDAILLLEDVDEKPFRIDRMLFQLRRAGKFRDIRGVIFGEMPGCGLPASPRDALHEVIQQAFADFSFPVAFGLRFGHNTGKCLTLPLGVHVRLDAGDFVSLTFRESAVRLPQKRARRRKG